MIKIRTCIACKSKFHKTNLIRIVEKESVALIDIKQNLNKRGVYLCSKKECIDKLINNKSLAKILKIKVDEESFKNLLKKHKEEIFKEET